MNSSDKHRPGFRRRHNAWTNLVVGLTILGCGTIFWLDHLGRLNARQYLEWWPAAVLAFGLAQLLQRQWVGGAIWGAVAVVFLLPLLGLPSISAYRILGLWPLLYSLVGLTLVMQALRSREGGERFHALAVMAGNVRRLGSAEFRGGDAIAVMGGCEIDLSSARLTRDAVIDVLAFWGGVEIRVPRGWSVVWRATTILGGIVDSTDEASAGAPQLVIRGNVIMGGVEVRHPAEAQA